jgi:hypothetical protein
VKRYVLLGLIGILAVGAELYYYRDSVYRLRAGEERLSTRLDPEAVQAIDILGMPPNWETRIRIEPNQFERGALPCKLEIRDGAVGERELTDVLYNSAFRKADLTPDTRTAVIFYGKDNRRLAGIYFDGMGYRASLDDIPVKFRGKIYGWVTSHLKCP